MCLEATSIVKAVSKFVAAGCDARIYHWNFRRFNPTFITLNWFNRKCLGLSWWPVNGCLSEVTTPKSQMGVNGP